MNKVIVFFLIIITVVLVGGMWYLVQRIDTLDTEIANLKTENTEAQDMIDTNTTTNTTNTTKEATKSSGTTKKEKVEFDPDKMKISADDCEYTLLEEDEYDLSTLGLKTTIEDGKAFVSVKFSEDYTADLYGIDDEIVDQEITGFKSEPVMCFTAVEGNGLNAPVVCFLMDDGTVEMLDTKTAFKNEKYVSGGKIKGLENIVSFELVSVHENDGGGYVTTVAIDEDGYAYDIFEIIDR